MGDKCSYIYLASVYEEKKIIMLQFLQSICSPEGVFPADLMTRMKDFCEADEHLKSATKVYLCMCVYVCRVCRYSSPLSYPLSLLHLLFFHHQVFLYPSSSFPIFSVPPPSLLIIPSLLFPSPRPSAPHAVRCLYERRSQGPGTRRTSSRALLQPKRHPRGH